MVSLPVGGVELGAYKAQLNEPGSLRDATLLKPSAEFRGERVALVKVHPVLLFPRGADGPAGASCRESTEPVGPAVRIRSSGRVFPPSE